MKYGVVPVTTIYVTSEKVTNHYTADTDANADKDKSNTYVLLPGETKTDSNGPWINTLGPVVQSSVSLTSLLRGQLIKCFTTLL